MEKEDGEGAIHFQDLLSSLKSRKLAAPTPPSRLFPASGALHPADPAIPIVPELAFGLRECSKQIYIPASSHTTASALVGTLLVRWGGECQGRARQGGRLQSNSALSPCGDPSRATIQIFPLMRT